MQTAAQAVLDARHVGCADAIPDRAVDRCYRPDPFPSDRHRVEYLFALYEKITAPLVAAAKPKRRRKD